MRNHHRPLRLGEDPKGRETGNPMSSHRSRYCSMERSPATPGRSHNAELILHVPVRPHQRFPPKPEAFYWVLVI